MRASCTSPARARSEHAGRELERCERELQSSTARLAEVTTRVAELSKLGTLRGQRRDLEQRTARLVEASATTLTIAGVGAAASVVFAALLLRHRKSARASARAANLHALPLRGGFVIGGGMRF